MNYNNSVLIGNWSEERLLREYDFKLFLRKRDRRELLLQRSRTLFSNLLCERPLALSGTHIMIGYNAQVVASDMPVKAATATTKAKYGLALSSLVNARQVDFMQNINDGCLMTLSPITTPCCRNTYIIESNDPKVAHGSKLTYGQEFLLRAVNYGDPKAAPLYVKYVVEGVPTDKDRMPIYLSAKRESSCRWMAIPLMKRDRLETLGSPVKAGEKLLIKNCVSDTCLSVMNQSWLMTFFGPECGVNCQDYINVHKLYTAENVFSLVSDVETKSKNEQAK